MLYKILSFKKIERKPWEMFFIGLFYSFISVLIVEIIFSKDFVLREYSSLLVILLCLICCFPYIYLMIKREEGKDLQIDDEGKLIKEHFISIRIFSWLFLGLVLGFSLFYILNPESAPKNFEAQIKTFCAINAANNFEDCISSYGITGAYKSSSNLLAIFSNNISVLAFTLFFSLFFGAGAIFILLWNASVIGAAIGIYAESLTRVPFGLLRYMIHGLPEILSYFIAALAGGMISVAIIRKDLRGERVWVILEDSIILIIISILILIISAFIEVYITPIFI